MRKLNITVIRAVIATGVSSVITQIITIREFLSQFLGNEFIIAIIFFLWMVIGGIGSLFAQFFKKDKINIVFFGWLSLLISVLPLFQIILIRYLRDIFFIHGTSVGFYEILAYIFSIISPYCFIIGFILPYSLFIIQNKSSNFTASKIYIYDNIGDAAGGAIFSFFFINFVSPFASIILSSLPLLFISIYLINISESKKIFKITFFLLSISGLIFFVISHYYEKDFLLNSEKEKLILYKESHYGRIQVFEDNEQITLFQNGYPLFCNNNKTLAEEIAHYPLSQINKIDNILLISAEGGLMKEIEKYETKIIDYVEPDPEIVKCELKFDLIKSIKGLNIIYQDGKKYLSKTKIKYNAILINLPEPDTFQLNRFYTYEFFKKAKEKLFKNGVLSFGLRPVNNYLNEIQIKKISSLYNTASKVFKNIIIIPGTKTFFICSDSKLSSDIPDLLKQKQINTDYIEGYFYGDINSYRIDYVKGLIDKKISINSDYYPFFVRLMFDDWFFTFSTNPIFFLAVIIILLVIYLYSLNVENFVLFSTGFCVMGTEILVIFIFQIFYGYVYYQLGLIVTLFLIGLLPGVLFGEKFKVKGLSFLIICDIIMIMIFLFFIFNIIYFQDELPVLILLLSGFSISIICGMQFPVALFLRGEKQKDTAEIFASDLIGASTGTLAVAAMFIPYFGIIITFTILIILKIISALCISIVLKK